MWASKLGKTEYFLEEQQGGVILAFTRRNGDGDKQFFVPRDLVLQWARATSLDAFDTLLEKLLR